MNRKLLALIMCMASTICASAGKVRFKVNSVTGAINEISIDGDKKMMDWMLRTDGKQYAWVTEKYGWGLGYLTANGETLSWLMPTKLSSDGLSARYKTGCIQVDVKRKHTNDGFTESYTFTNKSKADAMLTDIGIYTPMNDNYPQSQICMDGRCNAHIWTGGNTAYIEALRMNGQGDGIGLTLTNGRIDNYDVWERGMKKSLSNFRGVLALCPADTILHGGRSFNVSWRVFRHEGRTDFLKKAISYGAAIASSDKYIYEVGETAKVKLKTAKGTTYKDVKISKPGEITVTMNYGKGKFTTVKLLGVSSYEGLIERRANFIISHQQMNDTADARCGALMVYDNELDKLYLNDDSRRSSDTDEGRERVGMGVMLAKWCKLHPNKRLEQSLVRYARYIKDKLQTSDYTTYSKIDHTGKIRGYNYPWIADFFFLMHEVTGERQYAIYGYHTMRAFFKRFKYDFYAIDIPVTRSLTCLNKAGLKAECDTLLNDYRLTGDKFVENGLNFPSHEVNYEQSIVAPAVQFLSELYLATHDNKYLSGAQLMMPALEAFTGQQPSFHLNGIAIRHWDGYWFGKRQLFGDTFPHYWSTLNATAYHYYGKCVGDDSWQHRAENIVRNNLCLFFEDGRASCAYLYPRMVNGEKAQYYDAFANDQDWALAFYLSVNYGV